MVTLILDFEEQSLVDKMEGLKNSIQMLWISLYSLDGELINASLNQFGSWLQLAKGIMVGTKVL